MMREVGHALGAGREAASPTPPPPSLQSDNASHIVAPAVGWPARVPRLLYARGRAAKINLPMSAFMINFAAVIDLKRPHQATS